ncbi:MAG: hypothetical protein WCY11_09745 [Novosphingobium sp.]
MRATLLICSALAALLTPHVALADDPNDPAMRTAAARARDKAIIRQLNLQEAARVRERDARYAEGWRAKREEGRMQAEYARSRAEHERRMVQWRRQVAACRAGDYSACDG